MSLFAPLQDNALYFSRHDPADLLGSFCPLSFQLDDAEWPTVEHYYQAMKFTDVAKIDEIRNLATPLEAQKAGNRWWRRPRQDWAKLRVTMMTRGIYIRAKTHTDCCLALLKTGDQTLIENSNYDYFWGCGRDRRGHNEFGKLLMRVRDRLREETL